MTSRDAAGPPGRAGPPALRPSSGRLWPSPPRARPPGERKEGRSERRGRPDRAEIALSSGLPRALRRGSGAVREKDAASSYPARGVGATTSGREPRFRGGPGDGDAGGARRGISTTQRQLHTYVRKQGSGNINRQIEV